MYELVNTAERLDMWVQGITDAKLFAIDTETTGFNIHPTNRDPIQDEIVGVSLAVDGAACYIPVRHVTKEPQLDAALVFAKLKPILEDENYAKVLQNAPFDIGHFRNEGIILRNVHDTQVMSFALSGDGKAHNMDDMAWEHLDGYDTSKFNDVVIPAAGHQTFADVRLDHATYYAAEDTAVTLKLFHELRRKLKAAGLWKVYQNIDRVMPEIVARMQHDGVYVDTGKLKELEAVFQKRITELEAEIHALVGPVNLNSANELRELLFETLKLTPRGYTKGGAPSTDAKLLEQMAGEHEVLDLILEWKTYGKLLSTYVLPLPREVNPLTERIHPQTNLTFTDTGRLSMSNPSLHQIPAREKRGLTAGMLLREAFIAPPGYKIIASDYSQIEVRVLAHRTGEPGMIEAFERGYDFHAANAARIFGGTPDQYMDKKDATRYAKRTAIKSVTFGLLYGAGPKKVATEAKISEYEARSFIDAFFEANPCVSAFIEEQHELVHQNGYVETVFGRRLPVYGAGDADKWVRFAAERKSVNYVIQGSAAELNKLAMQAVSAEITVEHARKTIMREFEAELLLSVHDELVLECDEPNAERFALIVQDCMEHAADHLIEWRVPIVAEPGIGQSWYEAKNA